MATNNKKQAGLLSGVKNLIGNAAQSVGNTANSAYQNLQQQFNDYTKTKVAQVQQTVAPVQDFAQSIPLRLRNVAQDVQQNPNNYNVFAQVANGNVRSGIAPIDRTVQDVVHNPDNYNIFSQFENGNVKSGFQPLDQTAVGAYKVGKDIAGNVANDAIQAGRFAGGAFIQAPVLGMTGYNIPILKDEEFNAFDTNRPDFNVMDPVSETFNKWFVPAANTVTLGKKAGTYALSGVIGAVGKAAQNSKEGKAWNEDLGKGFNEGAKNAWIYAITNDLTNKVLPHLGLKNFTDEALNLSWKAAGHNLPAVATVFAKQLGRAVLETPVETAGLSAYNTLAKKADFVNEFEKNLIPVLKGNLIFAGGYGAIRSIPALKESIGNALHQTVTSQLAKDTTAALADQSGGIDFNAKVGSEKNLIYHGTPETFTKFDPSKTADGGTWFTSNPKEIVNNTVGATQASGQTLNIMTREMAKDLKLATPEIADKYFTDQLIQMGYDGVKMENDTTGSTWYKIFDPNASLNVPPRELEKAALATYGEAQTPQDTAFITSKGEAIDGSGYKDGGSVGSGHVIDHRQITNDVWEKTGGTIPETTPGSNTASLTEFMNQTGSIRTHVSGDGTGVNIDIMHPPSKEQLDAIRDLSKGKEINLDISNPDGTNKATGVFNTFEDAKNFISKTLKDQTGKLDINAPIGGNDLATQLRNALEKGDMDTVNKIVHNLPDNVHYKDLLNEAFPNGVPMGKPQKDAVDEALATGAKVPDVVDKNYNGTFAQDITKETGRPMILPEDVGGESKNPEILNNILTQGKNSGGVQLDDLLAKVANNTITPEEAKQLKAFPEIQQGMDDYFATLTDHTRAIAEKNFNLAFDRGDARNILSQIHNYLPDELQQTVKQNIAIADSTPDVVNTKDITPSMRKFYEDHGLLPKTPSVGDVLGDQKGSIDFNAKLGGDPANEALLQHLVEVAKKSASYDEFKTAIEGEGGISGDFALKLQEGKTTLKDIYDSAVPSNGPLPWEDSATPPKEQIELGPSPKGKVDPNKIMTSDDVQTNLTTGEAQQYAADHQGNWLTRGWNSVFNPAKNAPESFQQNVADYRGNKLLARSQANDLADYFANEFKDVKDKDAFKLVEYMQNPTEETAKRIGLSQATIDQNAPALDNLRSIYDDLRKEAIAKGLDVNYVDNYINQVWEQSPAEIQKKLVSLSDKPYFTKERVIPSYEEGLKAGLTPKFTHPAALIAHYQDALDSAMANRDFADQMEKSGYLIPSNRAPSDWTVINAPLFPKATQMIGPDKIIQTTYSAPDNIATPLNNIFNRTSNGALHFLGDISGNLQNITLSGGIPGTPVNAFAAGQAIKETTAGNLSSPIQASVHSLSDASANQYFAGNQSYLNMMAKEDIPLSTSYDYANRFANVIKDQSIKEKISGGFHDLVDNPTFQRFYPILETETFKNTYNKAVEQGMAPEAAQKLAGDTIKNFYGVVDEVTTGRNANVSEAMKAFFFAPRFREAMVNLWTNTAKSLNPAALGDKSLGLNRQFAMGTAATYGIYDLLNYKLTGRHLWQNPQGKEFTLLIPTPKDSGVGGKTIGLPILPSVATLPRMAGNIILDLAKGDPHAAVAESRKAASSAFKPFLDIMANEDYFGRPIYEDADPALTKYQKIGGYLFQQDVLAHPYLKTAYDVFVNKKDMSTAEITSTALELPVRFYKADSITNSLFFEKYNQLKPTAEQYKKINKEDPVKGLDFYNKNKDQIDQFNALAPIVSAYYQLKDKGDAEGAADILNTQIQGKQTQSDMPTSQLDSTDKEKKKFATDVMKSTLTADQKKQALDRFGISTDQAQTWHIQALPTDEQAQAVYGLLKQDFPDTYDAHATSLIKDKTLTPTIINSMLEQGAITLEDSNHLHDLVDQYKVSAGLKDKLSTRNELNKIDQGLNSATNADDFYNKAQAFVESGELTTSLINKLLEGQKIDIGTADSLKKMVSDHRIKVGVQKAPKPKKLKQPKTASISKVSAIKPANIASTHFTAARIKTRGAGKLNTAKIAKTKTPKLVANLPAKTFNIGKAPKISLKLA